MRGTHPRPTPWLSARRGDPGIRRDLLPLSSSWCARLVLPRHPHSLPLPAFPAAGGGAAMGALPAPSGRTIVLATGAVTLFVFGSLFSSGYRFTGYHGDFGMLGDGPLWRGGGGGWRASSYWCGLEANQRVGTSFWGCGLRAVDKCGSWRNHAVAEEGGGCGNGAGASIGANGLAGNPSDHISFAWMAAAGCCGSVSGEGYCGGTRQISRLPENAT